MGRHSGRRRAPRLLTAGVLLAPLLALVLGAVVVLPVSSGLGVGGAPRAYAAPVDPTPSRPATPPGKAKPTPTPTLTQTPTDPPTSPEPTDTSATSQPPSAGTATSTPTSGSGGSSGEPSFQSQPSQAPPPAATAPTGPVTTPSTVATPGGNVGGSSGGSNAGGGGGGQPSEVAVAGRRVASPAGDGRSTLDVVPAARTTAAPVVAATGSPDGTSSPTSAAPEPSGASTTSSPGPDLADPPSDAAIPGSWRLAALAALFVLALAVALLIAAARPRGGAHRRH